MWSFDSSAGRDAEHGLRCRRAKVIEQIRQWERCLAMANRRSPQVVWTEQRDDFVSASPHQHSLVPHDRDGSGGLACCRFVLPIPWACSTQAQLEVIGERVGKHERRTSHQRQFMPMLTTPAEFFLNSNVSILNFVTATARSCDISQVCKRTCALTYRNN